MQCSIEKPLTAAVSSPPPKFQTRQAGIAAGTAGAPEAAAALSRDYSLGSSALMTFRNRILRASSSPAISMR